MSAVLLSVLEREDGVMQNYRACHAGYERCINDMKPGQMAGHSCVGHWVEVRMDAMDEDLLKLGWQKRGRAWLCPEHAGED